MAKYTRLGRRKLQQCCQCANSISSWVIWWVRSSCSHQWVFLISKSGFLAGKEVKNSGYLNAGLRMCLIWNTIWVYWWISIHSWSELCSSMGPKTCGLCFFSRLYNALINPRLPHLVEIQTWWPYKAKAQVQDLLFKYISPSSLFIHFLTMFAARRCTWWQNQSTTFPSSHRELAIYPSALSIRRACLWNNLSRDRNCCWVSSNGVYQLYTSNANTYQLRLRNGQNDLFTFKRLRNSLASQSEDSKLWVLRYAYLCARHRRVIHSRTAISHPC